MNTNLFRSLLAGAVCCAAALLLDTTAPRAWGAYNATFVSATPQTPISLGQPLDITVLVRNNTGDTWVAGDMGASWLIEMDQPSWLPGADPIYFSTTTSIPDGVTASMVARLTAAELPAAPGTYTVRLYTAYNLYDYTWQYMEVGNPKIVTFSIKTNHPPVITPVGTKAGVPTNLLTFKVTATDTDQPAQTLTFNLEPGAPAGASINPTNGNFTWTPPTGVTPRTNQMSVRVVDNGSPPMSATNTFQVVVLAPPRFDRISRPTNGAVTLVWPTFSNLTYRVSYMDTLAPGTWTNLTPDIQATGPTASMTNNLGGSARRFFRLSIPN